MGTCSTRHVLPRLKWGNSGRSSSRTSKGQAYHNHDLALFKNFALGNGRKLQFRLSAYNFLNHPLSYPDPATNLTMTVTNGQLDDPNGDFGRLPKDNKFGRRIVQLGLRFLF